MISRTLSTIVLLVAIVDGWYDITNSINHCAGGRDRRDGWYDITNIINHCAGGRYRGDGWCDITNIINHCAGGRYRRRMV